MVTNYRRAAARCNYITQDRCDIAYATKEVARCMAKPTWGDVVKLKRLIRYLVHHPRGIFHFPWQARENANMLTCFVDSDWAGCVRTRKSTSGGFLMRGTHCLGHWSRTQANIALSSCEAELNAALKGGVECIGLQTISAELGREMEVTMCGDSSACTGFLHREGVGRIKHLALKQLWLQHHVKEGNVRFVKIGREDNPADSLAKSWAGDGILHFQMVNFSTSA